VTLVFYYYNVSTRGCKQKIYSSFLIFLFVKNLLWNFYFFISVTSYSQHYSLFKKGLVASGGLPGEEGEENVEEKIVFAVGDFNLEWNNLNLDLIRSAMKRTLWSVRMEGLIGGIPPNGWDGFMEFSLDSRLRSLQTFTLVWRTSV
jgi:hypothetical protein